MWKISLRSSIELAALLLIVGTTSTPVRASPPETRPIPDVAREVLEDGLYQAEWPTEIDGPGIRVPLVIGRIATLLLYIGFAVVIILVAIWVAHEFGGASVDAGEAAAGGTPGGPGPAGRFTQTDPERLAEQGQNSEAIHQLLLGAIWRLGRALATPPIPSSTSRELTRTLPLDRDGREAFEYIVRRVELTLFGGRDAGREEYDACKRRYDLLVRESAS